MTLKCAFCCVRVGGVANCGVPLKMNRKHSLFTAELIINSESGPFAELFMLAEATK